MITSIFIDIFVMNKNTIPKFGIDRLEMLQEKPSLWITKMIEKIKEQRNRKKSDSLIRILIWNHNLESKREKKDIIKWMKIVWLHSVTFHYGQKQPRIQTEVLGHSLVRSLVRSHRSLIRLLQTARFAHTRSLAADGSLRSRPPLRSLIRSLPRLWDSEWLDVSKWPSFVP